MVEHLIKVGNVEMTIWNDRGSVKQYGLFSIPEVLAEFGNLKASKMEAGAYMSGMIELARMLNE